MRVRTIFQQHSCRSWALSVSRAYFLAVPLAVLLCQFADAHFVSDPPSTLSTYDGRFQARLIGAEWVKFLHYVLWGYLGGIAAFLLEAAAAGMEADRGRVRKALLFVLVGLVSAAVLSMICFSTTR
jgi:hypothetical protein